MKELMLYIHIPFCIHKCNYCDFLSFSCSESEYELYLESLVKEINYKANIYKDYRISSVFIGGGTPSILPVKLMDKLLNALKQSFIFSADCEFSIEANPATLSEEKLLLYKQYGINRLSIGLQSANNEELRLLGRIHSYEDFLNNYYEARRLGFDNINVDIISALPDQSREKFLYTLNQLISLKPEHISCYSLIIEEGTPFSKMQLNIPDEELERDMYYSARSLLEANGYHQYEISNYARKTKESRHNSGYWLRKDYLGLGLAASSCISNIRWKNTEDFTKYVNSDYDKHDLIKLSLEEQKSEFMFLGLRMTKGISEKQYFDLFSRDLFDDYGKWLKEMFDAGLLEETDGNIRLTYRGMDLANYVMSGFLL